jgi:putative transcriptional regulator
MDIEKVAKAIEVDAGIEIPDLKTSLKEMQNGESARIYSAEQLLVRAVRKQSELSQVKFAERINTSVATLRDWEQGRFPVPGAAMCLLKLIQAHPELTDELNSA